MHSGIGGLCTHAESRDMRCGTWGCGGCGGFSAEKKRRQEHIEAELDKKVKVTRSRFGHAAMKEGRCSHIRESIKDERG